MRVIEAIKAFKATFSRCRAKVYTFTPGPQDLTMEVSRVKINTRLDAGTMETAADGSAYCGGCVHTRKNIDERRKVIASTILWTLEGRSKNIEPIERLCMSFDVFGRVITKAPKAVDRFRENVGAACREAASMWDGVEPPPGYDGPDWR